MKSKLATTCMITIAQRVRTRAHTLAHKPTDISIGIRWFEIEMNMCLCTLSCSTLSITERSFALQLKIDFHRNVNRLPSCWIGCFSCLILLHFFCIHIIRCGNKLNSSSIRMARFQQRTFWFSLILSLFTKWLDWSSDENQKNGMMSKCTRSTNSPKLTWKEDTEKEEPSKNHNTHFSYASFFALFSDE